MKQVGKIIRIRNTAGGESNYSLKRMVVKDEPTGAAHYCVVDHSREVNWAVEGRTANVVLTNDKRKGTHVLPFPPQYVLDRVHREWALDELRDDLTPGTTVHTILEHVGRSGMSRRIGVRVFVDNEPRYLDGLVAVALGYPVPRDGGIRVDGCGMDMGFALVYELSHALYPEGFGCIGRKGYPEKRGAICPSNDHSNGDRDYARHTNRAPHWHNDGGYALRQRRV